MSDLRRIGLIGGTSWASTAVYYRLLNESVASRVGGAASAPVTVWSLDFADVAALQHAGRWSELGALLADAARRLEDSGATAVALAANTLHLVADSVRSALSVPLVDIVDVTAQALAGHRRVGLLGTAFTMDSSLFADRLAQDGIEVVVPPAADRALVHDIIYGELTRGVFTVHSRTRYREVMARLVDDGVDAIVLACTEIGLLVEPADASVPLYDTAHLHCAALVEAMVGTPSEVLLMTSHTLSVLVENKPGVLVRVSGLFSRRGFNIESLAVGPTEHPNVSRITLVVGVEGPVLEQVTKQLNKLINVIKIVELEEKQAVQRELLLVKVRADDTTRRAVLETVELFKAKVADVGPEALTVELTGRPDKLNAMLRMLEPYGIREMVQSGVVALGRGPRSMTQAALRSVERSA